jgi:hypothetical protein
MNGGTGDSAGDTNPERCGILDAIRSLNVQGILDAENGFRPPEGCDSGKKAAQGLLDFEAVFLTWAESDPIMDRHEREH